MNLKLMIRGMETMNMRKLMRENTMLRELRMLTLRRSTWMMKMGMTSLWRLVSCSHDCGEGENVTEGTQSSAKHRTLSTLPASHCLCLQYTQVCSLQLSTPMSILTWVAGVSSKLSPPAVQGGSKEAMEKENIYVHPLVKRSSSSEKSLELCTENLGNETGTGINEDSIFLLPSSDSKDGNFRTREQTKSRQLFETKKANPPNFPSSLTTISGSESLLFRPHRENGRLIINAVKAPATQSYFQAERSHGRLRLCFLKTCTPSVDSEEAKDEENEAAMNTVMERRDLTLTLLKKNHKWKKKKKQTTTTTMLI
ncbi:Protein FANTASTIC FOUR 3 [Morella rubra]|uniref:Protein FANTASTIC FOUR 3 n=1 Tax=Morella rubra TaxID=262757 RepID=A0A6A1WRC0_9ROSI|nr:Protein FANTASTIC FOUR 3 [Morella rubra]